MADFRADQVTAPIAHHPGPGALNGGHLLRCLLLLRVLPATAAAGRDPATAAGDDEPRNPGDEGGDPHQGSSV